MNKLVSLGALIVSAGCTVYSPGYPPPIRPQVVVAGPRLVVIAGSDIRYCLECDEDVFFYLDWWYVYRFGAWYRCGAWGGPWVVVERGVLPAAFIRVPPGRFKRRWSAYHPAHDHHPDLDAWPVQPGAPVIDPRNDKKKDKGKGKRPRRGRS